MEPTPPVVRIEDLLAEREWVGRFARALVRGADAADDLEQDLWTSVLERPPARPPRSVRAWLAAALRFKAVDRNRAEGRRRSREEAAIPREQPPSVADALARGEVLRAVVVAVMALDEPYRSAVLLRYFEGLGPAEISARLGVPRETVRTRLRRALTILRERLDADHDGRRGGWVAALLPPATAAAPRGAPGGSPAAPALPTVPAGVLAMTIQGKASLAAAAAAVLLAAEWLFVGVVRDAPREDTAEAVPATASGRPGAPQRTRPAAGAEAPAATYPESQAEAEEAPGRPRGTVRGRVLLSDGQTPAAGVEVRVLPFGGAVPEGMSLPPPPVRPRTTRTGIDGRFVLLEVPAGAWKVEAAHSSLGRAEGFAIAGDDPPWASLRLEPAAARDARTLRVRVLDETGTPCAGAAVEAARGSGGPFATAVTDAEGRARVPGMTPARAFVTARSGGLAVRARVVVERDQTWVEVEGETPPRSPSVPPGSEVALTLRPCGAIAGRLTAPSGTSLRGTLVDAWALTYEGHGMQSGGVRRTVPAADDGTYRIDELPAGRYALLVRSPSGLRVPSRVVQSEQPWSPPALELPTATVDPGREACADLALVPGGTVRGRVERTDGSPVAGARVELHLPLGPFDYPEQVKRAGVPLWRLDADPWEDDRRHPGSWLVTATAADGTYEATGLHPSGAWRVRVVPGPDLSFDLRDPVTVDADRPTSLRHVVEPAGMLEALLPPFASVALRRRGEDSPRAAFVGPWGSGAVRIPGLPAGEWELLQVRAIQREELRPLGEFRIAAGETTLLDAPGAGLSPVVLRFVRSGRPVEGVEVRSVHTRGVLRSGPDGAARLLEYAHDDRSDRPVTHAGFVAPEPGAVASNGPLALGPAAGAGEWTATIEIPAGRLDFLATDAAGRPWRGARFRVTPAFAGRTPQDVPIPQQADRTTAVDGRACVAALPAGTYRWEVEFPDGAWRSGEVVLSDGGSREVPVQGEETTTLRVTVLDADGRPLEGARVHASRLRPGVLPGDGAADRWEGAAGLLAPGRTDESGEAVLRGVPAGTIAVSAVPFGGEGSWGREETRSETAEVMASPPVEAVVTVRFARPR